MKTATVIINGIKFPHTLIEHAIAWAKKEDAQLHGLFLTSGDEMPEEYAFPSDIDLAEKVADEDDSEKDSTKILWSQVKLFKTMLDTKDIKGTAERMNDASLEKVLEKLKSADLIFVAPDFGEISLQAVTRFKLQDVIDRSPVPVKAVRQ